MAMQPMGEDAPASASSPPPMTAFPSQRASPRGAFPTPVKQAAAFAQTVAQTEMAKQTAQGMFQAGKQEAEAFVRTVPCRLLMVVPPALLMLMFLVPCSNGCTWLNPRPRTIQGLVWTIIIPIAPFAHMSWAYLWIDLTSWLCLGWRLSGYGAGTFASLALTLLFVPGFLTWCTGSVQGLYTGMPGILFGIFGFNMTRLPVRYRAGTLTREDVVCFVFFDVLFGGMWWCFSYYLPPYTWVLALWGLFCGVAFAVYTQAGDRIDGEKIPLLVRTERCVEAKTGPYVDRLCA